MASSIPKEVKKEITDAWVAETWKVALYTAVPAISAYTTTNEVSSSGTGYTAGGATLASKAQSYVDTVNSALDAADTSWTTATFTARAAVVYSTASPYKVRAIYDFGADKVVTGGTFTIQWNSGGLIKIS